MYLFAHFPRVTISGAADILAKSGVLQRLAPPTAGAAVHWVHARGQRRGALDPSLEEVAQSSVFGAWSMRIDSLFR